jgi:dTDP-4-dehydrorhamnose 3,5-epimerase-like enzyme
VEVEWIDIPSIKDPRGNLAVLENSKLPFAIRRVFYLHDVPSGSQRGGHALKTTFQLLIPISGSFELVLKDGANKIVATLNNPTKGVLIPTMVWRELRNFSAGAVCLVVASEEYYEEDYIRNWDDFMVAVQ